MAGSISGRTLPRESGGSSCWISCTNTILPGARPVATCRTLRRRNGRANRTHIGRTYSELCRQTVWRDSAVRGDWMFDYDSVRWKRLARMVMRRDGYMCQLSKRYGAGANILVQKNTYTGVIHYQEFHLLISLFINKSKILVKFWANRDNPILIIFIV